MTTRSPTSETTNYRNEHYGNLSFRQALAYSDNIITVKSGRPSGSPISSGLPERWGSPCTHRMTSPWLGTGHPDLMLAYAPLANGGARPEPRTIIRIYEKYQNNWIETPAVVNPVLPPAIATVTTSMLKDVLTLAPPNRFTASVGNTLPLERPGLPMITVMPGSRLHSPVDHGVWAGYDNPNPWEVISPVGRSGHPYGGDSCTQPWPTNRPPIFRNLIRSYPADKSDNRRSGHSGLSENGKNSTFRGPNRALPGPRGLDLTPTSPPPVPELPPDTMFSSTPSTMNKLRVEQYPPLSVPRLSMLLPLGALFKVGLDVRGSI